MFCRIGMVLFFFLCALPVSAHEPILLDTSRATPGLHLNLSELPSTKAPASATARYQLQASGLPRGVVFSVWAKDFGHSFHEVAAGFWMDESGVIVSSELIGTSGRPRRLDEMEFEPGPYPRGAVWEVALVSADRTLTAFAKVIPRPIIAQDGPCTVALELVSLRGQRFMASGAGFAPGDDIVTESWYAGQIIQKRRRISAEGLLPPDVISHDSNGTDRSARYAVKSHSCEVAVEYEWGEPALSRR
jgi:hypothetical protein